MTRRHFIFSATASSRLVFAQTPTARITRIRVSPLQGRFHKFVAMNAYDTAPKGHTYEHALIRIETDQNAEGIGPGTYAVADSAYVDSLRPLIGADPLALYKFEDGRVVGRAPQFNALLRTHKHLDGALFDLIGKLTGKPVWQLLGPSVQDLIDVYDGTLYFSDVWFRDRGTKAVIEEAQEAVRFGYRAVKLKLGRGSKWMEKSAGLARDIDVVLATRKAVGPDVQIMCDPNDGYRNDTDRLWHLLVQTRQAKLYWLEEPFPENAVQYGRMKDIMAEAGINTLIADGENFREPEQFTPFLKPRRVMDVLQLDIRTGGILANREVAKAGDAAGALTIPHNWASRLGFLMALHVAKSTQGVPLAEDDRSSYDVVMEQGYEFALGRYKVSDLPGLGVHIDERAYELKCKPKEMTLS